MMQSGASCATMTARCLNSPGPSAHSTAKPRSRRCARPCAVSNLHSQVSVRCPRRFRTVYVRATGPMHGNRGCSLRRKSCDPPQPDWSGRHMTRFGQAVFLQSPPAPQRPTGCSPCARRSAGRPGSIWHSPSVPVMSKRSMPCAGRPTRSASGTRFAQRFQPTTARRRQSRKRTPHLRADGKWRRRNSYCCGISQCAAANGR